MAESAQLQDDQECASEKEKLTMADFKWPKVGCYEGCDRAGGYVHPSVCPIPTPAAAAGPGVDTPPPLPIMALSSWLLV